MIAAGGCGGYYSVHAVSFYVGCSNVCARKGLHHTNGMGKARRSHPPRAFEIRKRNRAQYNNLRRYQPGQEEQMTAKKKWKMSKDPLFRGDSKEKVCVPNPHADDSIVRHVMYFEGPGRETPYLSTSEEYELAENFSNGAVWETLVKIAKAESVDHIGRTELLSLMKGNGKGKAKWPNPFEVMQARRYVEQWGEHLLDFREVENPAEATKKIFSKS